MKVFVTGASGFIGRSLVQRLVDRNDDVTVLLRKPVHNLPERIQVIYGDILSPVSWKDLVYGCDRLYHLAGMISFDLRQRERLLLVNVAGTSNVLQVALDARVASTVIVSSASTMGLSYARDFLLDENSALDPGLSKNNPYLESKIATEKEAVKYSSRIKVVIVNPSTVYGPGDWTLNSGTLIKKIAGSCILPVPPGGSNVVDIDDVVSGIILAGENGASGTRYILGGENLTFWQIFSQISEVIKGKHLLIPINSLLRKPLSTAVGMLGRLRSSRFLTSEVINDMFAYKYYSTKLAEDKLGFNKKYSFIESVQRAWNFYKKNCLI